MKSSKASPAQSPGSAIDEQIAASGAVRVDHADATVEVTVEASGPVGVRLRGLHVQPTEAPAGGLRQHAANLERSLRPGGQVLRVVELDPDLGGGTLRTREDEMTDGRYFQVDLTAAGTARVRRFAVGPESGERLEVAFDLTRDQLRTLVDRLVPKRHPHAP